ncbi:MAG TPA: hypothetical protein DIU35_13225 [Candidatus Latescibacteria bacterium]|nr:hypothetical protein [Candidatus Latescibacterota bacterium]
MSESVGIATGLLITAIHNASLTCLTSKWFDRMNRQLMDLEKSFIHKTGLQDRPLNRSLFTAEDPLSGYGSWMLPDLRYELEHRSTENRQKWESTYVRAVETLGSRIRKITESLSSLG